MKRCPKCSQTFSDDNTFCQSDGTGLVSYVAINVSSTETPTVALSNLSTSNKVVAQRESLPKWLYPLLGVLSGLVIIFGFLAFYNFVGDQNSLKYNYSSDSKNKSQEKLEKTESRKQKKSPQKIIKEQQRAKTPKYPTVSRIKFRRGAITSTNNGHITENGQRKFLLKARSGQYLNASVASRNNCISINGEGSSTAYYTIKGDNQIRLHNSCGATSFSLTVSIR